MVASISNQIRKFSLSHRPQVTDDLINCFVSKSVKIGLKSLIPFAIDPVSF